MIVAGWPVDAPRGAVARFCVENGVSRSWFYEVRGRASREGVLAASRPASRRPRSCPGQTPVAVEDLAVRLRKELAEDGWDHGPESVRQRLLAAGVPAPSRATLARLFTRRGLVVPAPNKRPRSSWRRFVYAAPNECWQLDGTAWVLADGTAVVVLQLVDDHSRFIVGSRAAPGETAVDALAVVETAMSRYGVPQRLLSDNGTAFNPTRRGWRGLLETRLRTLGVQPISSRPNHPQTNGKNERAHSTLKRWLRARPRAATLTELQTQLDTFDEAYNQHRPHQGLAGATPAQAWAQTPVAAAPQPPASHHPHRSRPVTPVRSPMVASNGNLSVAGIVAHIGTQYAGRRVVAVLTTPTITIFDQQGTHLRTLTTHPGQRYYPSGLPRGKKPKPTQAPPPTKTSTMS